MERPTEIPAETLATMSVEDIEAYQLKLRQYADDVQAQRRRVAAVRNGIVNYDNLAKRIKSAGLEGQVTVTVPNTREVITGGKPEVNDGN